MGENSAIEWTDATFNPWWGCTRVSPACDDCYAASWAHRLATDDLWDTSNRRTFGAAHWALPFAWNRRAHRKGKRLKVFCASMADLFDKDAPAGERANLWDLIDDTPHLDWLVLTKRVGNVERMIPPHWGGVLPRQVWLGISIANQLEADRDIDKLRDIAAWIRFISFEPLLGPVVPDLTGIHMAIVGGESGRDARPMHPAWARSLRDQCVTAGVAFHFKQWGEWAPGECAGGPPTRTERVATWWNGEWHFGRQSRGQSAEQHRDDEPDLFRLGKKAAGRMLDGRVWDEFPEVREWPKS